MHLPRRCQRRAGSPAAASPVGAAALAVDGFDFGTSESPTCGTMSWRGGGPRSQTHSFNRDLLPVTSDSAATPPGPCSGTGSLTPFGRRPLVPLHAPSAYPTPSSSSRPSLVIADIRRVPPTLLRMTRMDASVPPVRSTGQANRQARHIDGPGQSTSQAYRRVRRIDGPGESTGRPISRDGTLAADGGASL